MIRKLFSIMLLFFYTSYNLLQSAQKTIDPQTLTDAILQYQATKHDATINNKDKIKIRRNLINILIPIPMLPAWDSRITPETINEIKADLLVTELDILPQLNYENEREKQLAHIILKRIATTLEEGINPFDSYHNKETIQRRLNNCLQQIFLNQNFSPEEKDLATTLLIKARANIWDIQVPNLTNDEKIKILQKITPESKLDILNRQLANTIIEYNNKLTGKLLDNEELLKTYIKLEQKGARIDDFKGVIKPEDIQQIKLDVLNYKNKLFHDFLTKLKAKISEKKDQKSYSNKNQEHKDLKREEYINLQNTEFINFLKQDLDSDLSILKTLNSDQIVEVLALYMKLSVTIPWDYVTIGGPTIIRQTYLSFTSLNVLQRVIALLNQSYIIKNFHLRENPSLSYLPRKNSEQTNLITFALASKTFDLAYALLQRGAQLSQEQSTLDDAILAQHFPTYVIFCQLTNTWLIEEITSETFSIQTALSMPGFDATMPLFKEKNLFYTNKIDSLFGNFFTEKKSLIQVINHYIQYFTMLHNYQVNKKAIEANINILNGLLQQIKDPNLTEFLHLQEMQRPDITNILINLL